MEKLYENQINKINLGSSNGKLNKDEIKAVVPKPILEDKRCFYSWDCGSVPNFICRDSKCFVIK